MENIRIIGYSAFGVYRRILYYYKVIGVSDGNFNCIKGKLAFIGSVFNKTICFFAQSIAIGDVLVVFNLCPIELKGKLAVFKLSAAEGLCSLYNYVCRSSLVGVLKIVISDCSDAVYGYIPSLKLSALHILFNLEKNIINGAVIGYSA